MNVSDIDKDILLKLSEMEANVDTNNQHIRDSGKMVERIDHILSDLIPRLARVERKTAGLSERPETRNCPHCTKIIRSPGTSCPHCGKPLYT